jgi:hypothetical protein
MVPEPSKPDEDDEDVTADAEATVLCPYCGASVELTLDPSGGSVQDYVEDCSVCCQPWRVQVRWRRNGRAEVSLDTTDG